MRFLALVLIASGVASSYAACSNNCNGKGTCVANDKCSCFHAFNQGSHDCSKRRCPYGLTWSTTASARSYAECSDAGTCNTGTGECQCFDGYTGHDCGRKTCQNDCSGHGECQTLKTWGLTGAWDSDMTQACRCDPGYTGISCSERSCPVGDDPLTTGQTNQIQTCTMTYSSGSGTPSGSIALQLTDWTGQVHTTRAIEIFDSTTPTATTAHQIAEAIQALPNNVFESVTVGITASPAAANWIWTVTFSSTENTGTIPVITIVQGSATLDDHGNQPVLTTLVGFSAASCAVSTAATSEGAVCSGRGNCKSDEGLCQCGRGYYGRACEYQTSIQ